MYYLKYRPQTLEELDSQSRKETLTKIFQKKEIPHAFLFTGPKGIGKTSTARIIAKILNCDKRQFKNDKALSVEPCNHCQNCKAITRGNFLDVIELDAASSRGIDDIRALRDTVAYTPSVGRYKIYIIDEVHMLTKEAFNALLKTLEEPPSHVVFILATTEPQKLPETISSRCLTIPFNKALPLEIKQSLIRIVKGEKLTVKDEVLELIAGSSQGSFRDAAKLLEMAVATTDLSINQVKALLKNHSQAQPEVLLELVLSGKTDQALSYLTKAESQGIDYLWLIEELLEWLKTMLLVKQNLIDEAVVAKMIKTVSLRTLSRLMKLLLEAYSLTKQSPLPAIPLMICIVEFGQEDE